MLTCISSDSTRVRRRPICRARVPGRRSDIRLGSIGRRRQPGDPRVGRRWSEFGHREVRRLRQLFPSVALPLFTVSHADINKKNPFTGRLRHEISKASAGRWTRRGHTQKNMGGRMMCEAMSGREERRFGRRGAWPVRRWVGWER